jgi:hypothetical protein
MKPAVRFILWYFPYEFRRSIYKIGQPDHFRKLQERRALETLDGYSYKPFDQNQCIFVHIPKTAGVSICRSLFGNLAGGHTTIHTYQMIFDKNEFDNYFKFTFVRNPWDRLVSAYNFLKSGGMSTADNRWIEKNLFNFHDFDNFVLRGIKRKNIKKYLHFRPQHEYVCEPRNKRPRVNFIGFYENIQNDFNYVKQKLGISTSLIKANVIQSNGKGDYKEYYTPATKKIVSDVYKKDIEIFGYDFDNSSLENQIADRCI